MARIKSNNNGVKYTVVIPESDIQALKEMAEKNIIKSVNAGVREAVQEYITKIKKENYKKELIKAVNDPEFIERNQQVMNTFESADKQSEGMIPQW